MKKLMIMACAVAMASVAQAATISWQSGALYTAAGKDGGWSSTLVNAAGVEVTMNVFLVDAATYATVSAMSQADMFAWTEGKTADYTGKNLNGTAKIGAVVIRDTDVAGSTDFYTILTATYTDATYGDMFMAKAVPLTASQQGVGNAANIFATAQVAGNWQAVPEPTSGLLLLLGVAGLALKRKRA